MTGRGRRWALIAVGAGIAAGFLSGAPAVAAPVDGDASATSATLQNLAVYRPSELGVYVRDVPGSFDYFGQKNVVPFFVTSHQISTAPPNPEPPTTYYSEAEVYQRSTAMLTYSDAELGENETVRYGRPGDLPVVADWNGRGPSLALFRPSTATWYAAGPSPVTFGRATDVAAPADFAGLGGAQIAQFRPSDGTWYIRATGEAAYAAIPFGRAGDTPVPADYAGTGKAQIAVFRPSDGTWYVRGVGSIPFGRKGDVPVPGDYRGDGKTEIAVFRSSDATWYVRGVGSVHYGRTGDVPLPVPPPVHR